MSKVLTNHQIARVCHQANKAFCKSIGDVSHVDWEQAQQWQKDSAVAGVEHIINNPNAAPSDSHESWLKFKENDGWSYGPVKDEIKKEHPCFVPYDELPTEEKSKDYIFAAVVKSLI